MSVNRKEILELLAAGKISAGEAAELLSNPAEAEPAAAPAAEKSAEPAAAVETVEAVTVLKETEKVSAASEAVAGKKPSWFRIRVKNLETGKNRVSVNLPLGMMKFGLKIGKQFAGEIPDFDWEELANMESGMIVEVEDEESNEHVQIFVE